MADNHLFRDGTDYTEIADKLNEHNDLHAAIRVADEAGDQDNLDILKTRVDDNVRELFAALGDLRALYGLLHVVSETFATLAADGIALEGENRLGINAFVAEGQRISEIAVLIMLTDGGGAEKGVTRSGFKPTPVDADLGSV